MGIFDDELILPGVITDIISDYSEGYDTSSFGTTDSVTIIGTAFNGPVGTPVKIYSPEHAAYIFGSSFNSTTRKEATLVAEIQDAWDRGCRTIYAVRVSGKEMYKDFQLASDTKYKLRVKGIFPHNGNKNVYFEYDAVDTLSEIANGKEAAIKIYKPATRATIEEKMLGKVVKENSILVNTVKIHSGWNIGDSSRLVDFIDLFNEYRYNNVLTLAIVDEDGNDITDSAEAKSLSFGDLFPGVYFIGRDANADNMVVKTEMSKQFVPDEARDSIYENFSGNVFKTLKVNTDVTKDLPIYHKDVTQFNKLIDKIDGVSMTKLFDFLEVAGKVDLLWKKDKVDYEEVTMSDFEVYKKLGSGFATNAKITETKEGSGVYKVVEVTSETDENRVTATDEGIYSMLENLTSDYRVLTGRYADTEIKGTLPKKKDFLVSNPVSSTVCSDVITVTPKLAEKDLSVIAKKYKFLLKALDEDNLLFSKDAIIELLYNKNGTYAVSDYVFYTDDIAHVNADEFESGDYILAVDTMYQVVDGKIVELSNVTLYGSLFADRFVVTNEKIYKINESISDNLRFKEVTDATEVNGAKYMVVEVRGRIVVFYIEEDGVDIQAVVPMAALEDVMAESSNMFALITPVFESQELINYVEVKASNLETTTLAELIIAMNEDTELSKAFEFDMSSSLDESVQYFYTIKSDGSDEYVFEAPVGSGLVDTTRNNVNGSTGNPTILDRTTPVYNKNLYIPFKTTDNFARHLAQHCIYTQLKTASTHGVIGCSRLTSTNLKNVAARVDKLCSLDLNLYAKKPNGNDMLDKNNTPYPIGRGVSVTFFQGKVETSDNYTYVSTGAAAYAGMVSALPIDQSSTSQPINVDSVNFELTNYQLGRLTKAGFVTVKNSYTNGYVITDGITMAPSTSSFRRLAVTRVINAVDAAIRAAAEPYIGKQNHLANRNALQTAIKSQLDKMLNLLIQSYDFKLVTDSNNDRLGIVEINYNVVPVYEIREVRNRVTVKDK